jgi:hypothetical protein
VGEGVGHRLRLLEGFNAVGHCSPVYVSSLSVGLLVPLRC